MDKATLDSYLSRLSFDGSARAVIGSLLDYARISANDLSKHTGLPRSSVYAALKALKEEGVVATRSEGGKILFEIASPRAFIKRIERRRDELTKQEQLASELADLLEHEGSNFPLAQIQSRQGKKSVEEFLFSRLPTWRASIARGDDTWWGYQDNQFVQQYSRWLTHTWATTAKTELVRLFSNPESIAQESTRKIHGRTIRPVPPGFAFASTVWIIGDFMVLVSTRSKPHRLIELRDVIFTASQRDAFRLLWHITS